jgi:hypothetical protein
MRFWTKKRKREEIKEENMTKSGKKNDGGKKERTRKKSCCERKSCRMECFIKEFQAKDFNYSPYFSFDVF